MRKYISECQTYQGNKTLRHKPYGKLKSFPIPSGPWEKISINFITGLPESLGLNGQNYNAILIVVNRFIKMVNFIPIIKYLNIISLARLINRQIYSHYEVPKGIINNRNPLFTSKFWSELCDATETKCKLLTAYHPQMDGQTERVNQELCRYLRNYIANKADT